MQFLFGHKIRVFSIDELKGKNNWAFFEEMEKKHINGVEGYLILSIMKNEIGKNTGVEISLVDNSKIVKNRLSFDGKKSSLAPTNPESVLLRSELKETLEKVFNLMNNGSNGQLKSIKVPKLDSDVILTGTNPIFALISIIYQYVLSPNSTANFKQVFNKISKAQHFDKLMAMVQDRDLTEYWTYTSLNLLVD